MRQAAVDFRDHAHNLIENAEHDHPELIAVRSLWAESGQWDRVGSPGVMCLFLRLSDQLTHCRNA